MEPQELQDLITGCISAALAKLTPQQEKKTSTEHSEYISKRDACKILKIGLTKLNELIKSGAIPSYRIGCNVRLIEKEVRSSLVKVQTRKGGGND
ncbi:MAG: helix-turn-helix domain-containing protein [Bacteroidia bacterium]